MEQRGVSVLRKIPLYCNCCTSISRGKGSEAVTKCHVISEMLE